MTVFSGGIQAAELLEDQAFNFQPTVQENRSLQLYWEIAPNHYLYKKQISVINSANASLIQSNTLPAGKTIHDPLVGDYEVYSNQLLFSIALGDNSANNSLLVKYQGCAKDGFCYLPITRLLTISGNNVTVAASDLQEFAGTDSSSQLSEMIADRFLPLTLLIFFGLGILLSFTPCVLPMIPLVVNLIIGPKAISTRRAFLLSSSYVLGMALCYTVAGIVAGLLGATLQAWMQQPVVLISLSILLVLLALGQFELIHVSLPHFNTRLHHWGQKQLQGSAFGAFILGIIASLIVSPCITPPLIGALTYISQNGNPLVGGLTLLSLSLGMGIPLIIVAMLSNMILPKAGAWMNIVKSAAGVALLGLAIWLLQRIIPAYVTLMLWGGLCIVGAVLLNAFEPLKNPKRSTRILKGLGIVLAIYGAGLIVNAIYQQFNQGAEVKKEMKLAWHNIDTVSELEAALKVAKAKQQYTLLDFTANWCTSCKIMETKVFSNPQIIEDLQYLNLLRVDMTKMDPKQKELLTQLEIYGPPVMVFFDLNGKEIKAKRTVGEIDATQMLQILAAL
jgi:thiol:disulfide interchange protein DsbD